MTNAAQAFIAFLRVEASNSEDRARSHRATAAAIEANAHEGKSIGRTDSRESDFFAHKLSCCLILYNNLPINYLVARGRKKRKRETKPKKAHTAYTLYVHENYESVKKAHRPDMPSKDIISLIARQWSQIGDQEKQAWQFRAEQLKEAQSHETNAISAQGEAIAEVGLPEPPSDDWDNRKRPARKAPPKEMTSL
jgi:hypothetical protein